MTAMLERVGPAESSEICCRARELYAEAVGPRRVHTETRVDKGCKRRQHDGPRNSEAAWLKRRRQEVADAVAHASRTSPPAPCPGDARPEGWQPNHEEELRKQVRRRLVRAAETFKDGHLLEAEATEKVKRQSNVLTARGAREDERRREKQTLREHRCGMLDRPLEWRGMAGATAWLDTASADARAVMGRFLRLKAVSLTED